MSDALMRLKAMGQLLIEQDNCSTAHPVFTVQQRRRIYGFDPDYSDDPPVWVHTDDYVHADEAEYAELEAEYQDTGVIRDNWIRTLYQDTWEFVMACLTREAAERFLERQRHNLTEPRVYVESGYRNQEWIDLRADLKELAGQAAETLSDYGPKTSTPSRKDVSVEAA